MTTPISSSRFSQATTIQVDGGAPFRRSRFVEHLDEQPLLAPKTISHDDDDVPALELPPPVFPVTASVASSVYSRSVGGASSATVTTQAHTATSSVYSRSVKGTPTAAAAATTPAHRATFNSLAPSPRRHVAFASTSTTACRSLSCARRGLQTVAQKCRACLTDTAKILTGRKAAKRSFEHRSSPIHKRDEYQSMCDADNLDLALLRLASPHLAPGGRGRRAVRVWEPLIVVS